MRHFRMVNLDSYLRKNPNYDSLDPSTTTGTFDVFILGRRNLADECLQLARRFERDYNWYHLVQRVLRTVPDRDMSVTVLGAKLPVPIGIAPTTFQRLAHPEGELAVAKAAAELGTIFTVGTCSTTPLEQVAAAARGACPLWMQVQTLKDRSATQEMVLRAEACGFKALVMTLDMITQGPRYRSFRHPLKLPDHLSICNIDKHLKKNPNFDGRNPNTFIDSFEKHLTWNDVEWLKNASGLPVVLKGITTMEDAIKAANLGVAAVWVSSHGARNLDSIEPTIDALPSIAAALSGTGCEVYVDGGIRWGSDVFKALALGAKCVFIGKPVLWGLAHSGKDGVRKVFDILKDELDETMQLVGCKSIKEIGPQCIKKKNKCGCCDSVI